MINDVARAFFEAVATREVCVELPPEALTSEDIREDRVGLLQKSLYGKRDAAVNWQETVSRLMAAIGFRRGQYNPCLYVHESRNIQTLIHGDDFVSVGSRKQVDWM